MLFALILLLSILVYVLGRTKKTDISASIRKIDRLIDNQKYDKATKSISNFTKGELDRFNYYRLIKRAMIVSEDTNNFSSLLTVSNSASEVFKGEEGFYAYRVLALLKLGDVEEAYNIADRFLVSKEYKPLLAQATLFRDKRNKLASIYVFEKNDPVYYEYLANLLDDENLYINAALLWARQGEIEKAFSLLKPVDNEVTKEAIALLAYDSGRRSEALVRLLNLPESDSIKIYNLKLMADLFYFDENWSRSRYYYEKVLEIDPYNSDAYINLSSIMQKSDQIKQSLDLLKNGIAKMKEQSLIYVSEIEFSKDDLSETESAAKKGITQRSIDKKVDDLKVFKTQYRDLVLLYYSEIYNIDKKSAVKTLEEFRQIFPDDIKIDLLIMKNKNTLYVPKIYEAKLWDLLNKDDNNKEVSEYLIWYLLGLGNFDSVELVLDRYENRNSDSNWTNYYRAILLGINGDYQNGLDKLLELKSSFVSDWEIYYTKAILNIGLNKQTEAIELLNKSIISINQIDYLDNKNIYLSRIKTKIAEVLISLNDIDEAIRVLNNAYELNPDNYRSDLLRSINKNIKERS